MIKPSKGQTEPSVRFLRGGVVRPFDPADPRKLRLVQHETGLPPVRDLKKVVLP